MIGIPHYMCDCKEPIPLKWNRSQCPYCIKTLPYDKFHEFIF